jgi:predicted  nucleic acid-binding Zn-ribbon protein
MREIMEKLLSIQKLELGATSLKLEHEAETLKLREQVPAPILGHFDRLIARGKKGVAVARNGACGECHLRLPSGTMAALAYTNEIHLCDNCGRYLYLPENEPLGLTDSPPVTAPARSRTRRTRQKADLHVA